MIRKHHLSALLVWLCTSITFLFGQEEQQVFQHYDVNNSNLPQGQVLSILEDSYGLLWISTMDGLAKFDGYAFHAIPNPEGVRTAARKIVEDEAGNIWGVSNEGLFFYNRVTNSFKFFVHEPGNPCGLPPGRLETICLDREGCVWLGLEGSFGSFDAQKNEFSTVPLERFEISVNSRAFSVFDILKDNKKNIWAASTHGLLQITPGRDSFTSYHPTEFHSKNKEGYTNLRTLYEDTNGTLWVGTDDGLYRWNPSSEQLDFVFNKATSLRIPVTEIISGGGEELWLASVHIPGLIKWDQKKQQAVYIQSANSNPYGLAGNKINALEIDRFNNLWIATFNSLSKLSLSEPQFHFYQQKLGPHHPDNMIYRAFQFEDKGLIYRTYDDRLFFSKDLGKSAKYIFKEGVHDFAGKRSSEIWSGAKGYLYHLNLEKTTTNRYKLDERLMKGNFLFIDEDKENYEYLWVNSQQGLCKIHKQKLDKPNFFPPSRDLVGLASDHVRHSWQMPNGYIYVQSLQGAQRQFVRFNKKTEKYDWIPVPDSLPSIRIRQMAYAASAKDTIIWVASPQGLVKINHHTKAVELITNEDGLPGNDVMGLVVDHDGIVWLKNMRHVTRYNPKDGAIQSFSVTKDMREFNTVGASIRKDERILFPGNNGFYAFYPDSIGVDSTRPDLVLTDFSVSNKPYGSCAPELIPEQEIVLAHDKNVVSFGFAALHFVNPENIRYKYKLEGLDEEWISAEAERRATYTNLNPKNYTFQVQATNSDGVWSPEILSINFTILPPWYRTWWAYSLWGLLTLGVVVGVYRFQLSRRLAQQKARNLQELDATKTRLYTNITHEFRTPLTLMLTAAGELGAELKKSQQKHVQTIRRNGQRLFWLINQLLDLSKMEMGKLEVNYVQSDSIPYLRSLTMAFEPYAESKDIDLQFHTNTDSVLMDFDVEKMEQIVSNLLSNAIKYNNEGGSVRVTVEQKAEQLSIQVKDDGVGIPESEVPHIFDRFHQVDASSTRQAEGTGIGLALAKELTELMGGTITVQSRVGQGSTFTVRLPIANDAPVGETADADLDAKGLFAYHAVSNGLQQPTNGILLSKVLIVEDHAEMQDYLKTILQKHYMVLTAANGREGIEMAKAELPDLIVSDVMMPEVDGFELCETLKEDELTCHIPIILLTAKADQTSKVEGLKYGADAYLAKPFQREELQVRVEKLLENRRKLQAYYGSSDGTIKAEEVPLDPFLEKAITIMTEHLSDEEFTIEQLSSDLCYTRQQVYGKIKQLTGLSPMQYLTQMRLEKAKQLLLTTHENISQIAYAVGYKTHGTFSTAFKNYAGTPPKAFREEHQQKNGG